VARFGEGQHFNDKGRPRKDQSPTEKLREFRKMTSIELDAYTPKDGIEEEAKLEIIASRASAKNGDIIALEKVRDRCEGKATESVDVSTEAHIVDDRLIEFADAFKRIHS
jgi:hypothetical protein